MRTGVFKNVGRNDYYGEKIYLHSMTGKIGRKIISTVLAVGLVSLLFAPFYQSSPIKEKVLGTPAGWTDDIRLTDNAVSDRKVRLDVDDFDIHLTWRRIDGNMEVFHIGSNDSGETWGVISQISNSGVGADNPDISQTNGNTHIVWDDRKTLTAEIYYRNSTDNGVTWNAERTISSADGYNSEGPRIAINNSNIHVIWVDSRHGAESVPANTEIYYNWSLDGGVTWGTEKRLTNALYASAPVGIAVNGSNIHVLFVDDRTGTFGLYYIRSTDNGVTWDDGQGIIGATRLISTNEVVQGAIAINGSDIHAVWINMQAGPTYRIYYRNSTDNGFSWNPVQLLSGPSPIMGSSDIAVWEKNVSVLWDDYRDDGTTAEIYYKNSTDGGINWNPDLRLTYNEGNDSDYPRIALYNDIRHITWYDDRNAQPEVYYKRFPETLPDTEPPDINHAPVPAATISQPINITANITDDVAVDTVYLNYTGVNGTYHNVSMLKLNGNWSYDIPGQNNTGFVDYFIWANDTTGNTEMTPIYQIQIFDVTKPEIIHTPVASVPLNTSIIIVANVTDDVGVANVILYYQNVGDTEYTSVDMALNLGNWTATIPAQTETGLVHYFIWANDTSGNNVTSLIMGDYAVQITGPPGIEITNILGGGEGWTGGSIHQIEFVASDTEDAPAILDVFLNYTSSACNGVIASIKGHNSPYLWTLPIIDATDVKVNATVIDSDGKKSYDDSPEFTIDSKPPEVISTNPANNTAGISTFQPIVIQFNEKINISSVIVNQTNGTDPGGWQWFWNADKDTITGIHDAWARGVDVEMTIQANYSDDSEPGNANNSAFVFSFTTEINPSPEIIHSNISEAQELGDEIRINATITDDDTVINAVLWWQDVDDVWHENYMDKNGDDWKYFIPGQLKEGKVRYQINATDDLQQKNTTIIYEFDITDTISPVIIHSPVVSGNIGETINITCQVSDLGGVGTVYLHYRNDTAANFTQVTMNPSYWYELAARSEPVTIEYYIRAVDIYGNEASTGIYNLEIIDPSVPDTTPPEILFVTPTGDNISVSTSISIVFSEAVNRTSVEGAILVSPVLSGISYTWLNDQTLVLAFDGLQFNTTYMVTIETEAMDLEGNGLAGEYSWQFSTVEEPEIVEQPTPDNWGWIGIIISLIIIIALLLLYLFNKEKEPDNIEKES